MKYLKYFENINTDQKNIKLLNIKIFEIETNISNHIENSKVIKKPNSIIIFDVNDRRLAFLRIYINQWERYFKPTSKKFISIDIHFDNNLFISKFLLFFEFINTHLSDYIVMRDIMRNVVQIELKVFYEDIPKFIKELDFYFTFENANKFNL